MSQLRRCLFGGLAALLSAACTESIAPPQSAVQLAFTVQPSSSTAGVAIGPVLAVAIQDAYGDLVTSATNVVTLTIATNPGYGTLSGTASATAVNGVASFSNLRIDKTGVGYTLKAAATGLTGATSIQFTIAAAPATRLVFTVQPSNALGSATIRPPVQVAAQDSFGNRATGFGGSVTVALGANSAAGTLSGTTVVGVVNGVATFSDLSIAQTNDGYTLIASAGALTGAASVPFSIAASTATLRITTSTSGSLPDPDGYAACIDPTSDYYGEVSCGYGGPSAVGVNGTASVTVDTGAHTVLLMGVAANCTVAGDNPRAVRAAAGQTAAVPFAVACAAATLNVTTMTTGASIDPDGYRLCIDPVSDWDFGYFCTTDEAVGVNSSVTVSVGAGTHVVQLDDVAANCMVGGDNPRTVDASGTTEVPFTITCGAAGARGDQPAWKPHP